MIGCACLGRERVELDSTPRPGRALACDRLISELAMNYACSDSGSTGRATKFAELVDLLKVSLAEKTGEGKKRERLVILGMLINIHEQSSLASIFKNDGVVVNCFIEA